MSNRTIQECNAQGETVRHVQVSDVQVRAPHGQTYTFVRGRTHTAYDVAAFAIRAARLNVSTEQVWMTASDGHNVLGQVFPLQTSTREGRKREYDTFHAATHFDVYLRLPGVAP